VRGRSRCTRCAGILERLKVARRPERKTEPAIRSNRELVADHRATVGIRAACRTRRVRAVPADPYRWARSLEILEGEGIPVEEFPQTPQRMGPATQRFYEAVCNQALTHDGDPRLARHVANAVLRQDSRGARITKEHKHSKRRIDGAVTGVMALHRAAELAQVRGPSIYV
jgi:phage terminase large subunit-like protein